MYASMNLQPPCSPIASDKAESAPVEFVNPWAWYDEAQAAVESSQVQHDDDSSDVEDVLAASSSHNGDNDGNGDDDNRDDIYEESSD